METNEDKAREADSCSASSKQQEGADCCSPSPGSGKSWKTVVFVLVIAAAGAVAAHSLLTNGGAGASSCCPAVAGKSCSPEKVCTKDVKSCVDDKAEKSSSCCPKAGTNERKQ